MRGKSVDITAPKGVENPHHSRDRSEKYRCGFLIGPGSVWMEPVLGSTMMQPAL